MSWVVRAGEAKAADLMVGYAPHHAVSGLIGFSVQYAPGKTVDELAQAGRFPNAQVSYQDEAQLVQATLPLGYRLEVVPSPGVGFHATCTVIYDANGTVMPTLPLVVAQALEAAFRRKLNSHRVRRGGGGRP